MTKLNAVNIGMNKYCGPAVLSILTGKSTDECARVISSINGQYNVAGVQLNDLLKAADRLGFDQRAMPVGGSLYSTLVMNVNNNGMYIFTLPNHFVCIEVNERKIYFCDNHTKEPMPAASSARLLQKVLSVHKVIRRQEQPPPRKPILISSKIVSDKTLTNDEGYCAVHVSEQITYDMAGHNKTNTLAYFRFKTKQEFNEFIESLTKE